MSQQICNYLPDHIDTIKRVDDFNDFFIYKTENIRRAIEETSFNLEHVQPKDSFVLSLTNEKQLSDVLIHFSESTSPIDPVPTKVQKKVFLANLNLIVRFINESLTFGNFPDSSKFSVIRPMKKKPTLNKNVLSNYRPVSNIMFLSKVLEKVFLTQLQLFIDKHGLSDERQSGYTAYHSTETALLCKMDYIYLWLDRGSPVLFVSLDMQAAFDTVDRSRLLDILSKFLSFDKTALSWIESYLSGRKQCVMINECYSEHQEVFY